MHIVHFVVSESKLMVRLSVARRPSPPKSISISRSYIVLLYTILFSLLKSTKTAMAKIAQTV